MAKCVYCQKPVGLFRKLHATCHERHQNAIAMIPTFFSKLLSSPLPAERFSELLHEVAKASYISPADLKSLFEAGIRTIVDEVLKTRLLTSIEEKRVAALRTSFGLAADDIPDSEDKLLDDKLLKVAILRDLDEGLSTERVKVAGPMPISFLPDEGVLWIFNRVACYRPGSQQNSGAPTFDLAAANGNVNAYIPPNVLGTIFTPKRPDLEEGTGDLLVTNFNIFFLSQGQIRKMPIAQINAIQAYADGIKVIRGASEETARSFVLDDPWFAINLILMVARPLVSAARIHEIGPQLGPL